MRDHEFTGDVNIPCEAYHKRYDRQFLRRNITGRQIRNTLHGVHTLMRRPRSRQRFLCERRAVLKSSLVLMARFAALEFSCDSFRV
jgi:hypothetical protein